MIARLTGRLLEKEPHQVLVDVAGVGYRAHIPLSTFYALPEEGAEVTLRIHTHVREDSLALYGFTTREEQELFERLIEISGIGPRLALAILSGLPASDLVEAISDGDAGRLRAIPGVGPRTADRVVLEMRDRIGLLRRAGAAGRAVGGSGRAAGVRSIRSDVMSALVNLGYREAQAEAAVRQALEDAKGSGAPDAAGPGAAGREGTLEEILRRSLKYLASRGVVT